MRHAENRSGEIEPEPTMGRIERARLGLLDYIQINIREPFVEGGENLPNYPCVVATSHLSDVDVLAVVRAIMGVDQRKIGISSQKTNFDLSLPAMKLAGLDHFFPLQNTTQKNGHASFTLNLPDFERMRDGITKERRTMVIAGHVPTRNWKLHRHAGIGPVLLAHMANVPLVPAVVDIMSLTPVAQSTMTLKERALRLIKGERPSAKIIFGKPMTFPEISEEELKAIFNLYGLKRENIHEEEWATIALLKQEQDAMMLSLAANLPSKKRGVWDRA